MAQFDFGTIDNEESGPALTSQLQQWRDAVHSGHKGPTAPAYAVAGTVWLDDSATPWSLKFYDGTDWLTLFTINAPTNAVRFKTESLIIAASDETTALSAGTAKVTFRMPYAFSLIAVRGWLTTAQASGSIFTVDINEGGVSILSTKLTIDNGEKTSTTAATPPVISDASLADDAEMTIDIDQVGTSGATGLKVAFIGYQN